MGLFDKWKKKEEEPKKDPYASVNNPQKVNVTNPYAKKEEAPAKADPYANIGKSTSNDPYANIGKSNDPYANIGKTNNDPYANIGKGTAQQNTAYSAPTAQTTTKQTGTNKSVVFTFNKIPTSLAELKSLPEASLDTPFKTVALTMLALLTFEKNDELFFEMLDFLNGPGDVLPCNKSFYRDRMRGKEYKARSFFKGSTPNNDYTPTYPLKIEVFENPYSYPEDNYAILLVESSGADSQRQVKLRRKPSTNQWFIMELQCLADIRIPTSEDPWA